jgi:membrane protein implicated in regulation of membrane protease activity
MNNHTKKFIAPIVVVVCISLYYLSIGIILWKLDIPMLAKIIALIVSAILTIILVMVLVERIKEINKGEEDDLGKY